MLYFITFMLMTLLYITQGLLQNQIINIVFVIITLLAFLLSFKKLSRNNRVFTGFLFLTGIVIHFIYGKKGLDLFNGLTQNLSLLVIILLAPLISLPLKGEGLLAGIVKNLNNHRLDDRKTYDSVSSFMLLLAPILNMGAVRIVHGLIEHVKINGRLLTNAYYAGFTPAIMWSPFFVSVGMVVSLIELPYLTYMPVGISFAIIQFIIALFILRPRKNDELIQSYAKENESLKENYLMIISYIVLLVVLITALEAITKRPILLLVSINCLMIPFLWTLFRHKWRWMKEQIQVYKNDITTNTSLEAALFLSAGLFGNALTHTPITSVLEKAIDWSAQVSIVLVFIFVVGFVTLMAFLGVHQVIVIPIVLPLLIVPGVGMTLHTVAFTAIYSWLISTSISPLNVLNIIISQAAHTNGIKSAFNWNGKYFLVSFLTAIIFVFFINLV